MSWLLQMSLEVDAGFCLFQGGDDDENIDFDDLTRRFEALKKKK